MHALARRVGRRSLARTIVIFAAGALGACADETTAPALNAPSHAAANTAAPSPEPYTTSVDLAVGGSVNLHPYAGALVRVALTCSTNQLVDLIVDLEQEQKQGSTKTLVQGSSGVLPSVECNNASGPYTVAIFPYTTGLQFQPGRGTVRARVTSTQPGVEPADVTRRVRMVVE